MVLMLGTILSHWYCAWASAAGGRGAVPPWIFIYGTNTIDKGLKVLFFGLFSVGPPPPLSGRS